MGAIPELDIGEKDEGDFCESSFDGVQAESGARANDCSVTEKESFCWYPPCTLLYLLYFGFPVSRGNVHVLVQR